MLSISILGRNNLAFIINVEGYYITLKMFKDLKIYERKAGYTISYMLLMFICDKHMFK